MIFFFSFFFFFRSCRRWFSCCWSLQVIRRRYCPPAYCRWSTPAQSPVCFWCWVHPCASGDTLSETRYASNFAYRGGLLRLLHRLDRNLM